MTALFQEYYYRLLHAQQIIMHYQKQGLLTYTPLLESPFLNARLGYRLLLKCENLQTGGAFKARGAFYKCSQLAKAGVKDIIAYSSGNHAWAVAMATQHLGQEATIIMPKDAPKVKIAQTQFFTDNIIFFDRNTQSREEIGENVLKNKPHAAIVPPYDDKDIIAGQGTTGLEIIAQCTALNIIPNSIIVPCGGGGLLAGTTLAVKNHHVKKWQQCALYGVEPALFNDTQLSLQHNKRIKNQHTSGSVCDGLLSPMPGALTFPINKKYVKNIVSVDDDMVMESVALLAKHSKIVTEPSGAVGLAALLHQKTQHAKPPKIVVAILSGGNAA